MNDDMKMYLADDPKGKGKFVSGVYFHGKLETTIDMLFGQNQYTPDLVRTDSNLVELPDGIHDVSVYNLKCKLYLWHIGFGGGISPRGLIVLPDDIKGKEQAQKAFNIQAEVI